MGNQLDFFNLWIADHVTNEDFSEGKEFAAKRLASRFIDDATTAGQSRNALEDEIGNVEKALLEILTAREENAA
jgi:hypothetical protein